jgi:hypothetical protein
MGRMGARHTPRLPRKQAPRPDTFAGGGVRCRRRPPQLGQSLARACAGARLAGRFARSPEAGPASRHVRGGRGAVPSQTPAARPVSRARVRGREAGGSLRPLLGGRSRLDENAGAGGWLACA